MSARPAWIVIALALWMPSRADAYRTLADDPEFASDLGPPTWSTPAIEVDVFVDRAAPVPAYVEERVRVGLETWSRPECTALRAVSVGLVSTPASPEDGRNTVAIITSEWDSLGLPDTVGATTDVQLVRRDGGAWEIVEADVYVDWLGHPWARDEGDRGLDGAVVLRHELGHVLGLAHPCEIGSVGLDCSAIDQESALYPNYLAVPELSADDIAGVCALYPVRPCDEGCPTGWVCESGSCVGSIADGGRGCDAGACERLCTSHSDCPRGESCGVGSAARGSCVPTGATGSECRDADECASSLCLAVDRGRAYCATSCEADSDCAPADRCATVEGIAVCAPRSTGGGCSVGGRAGAVTTVLPLLLAALLWNLKRSKRMTK